MARKTAKIDRILDIAIELLKNEGDFGLTMRKIATLADMSLSNVQYYFKTKDELLKAMADRYFQQCLEELREQPALHAPEDLKPLITMLLAHGHEISDMCRIFREYWAISTRNEVIESYLQDYYQSLVEVMKGKLEPLAKNERSLSQAVSILIPFVEGYSVTAKSLPDGLSSMSTTIEKIILESLQSKLQP